MPATTPVPLGFATTVRKWKLDVNTGTFGSPVWTGVFGQNAFKDARNPEMKDDSDMDSEGYKSEAKTADGFSIEMTVLRKATAADPEDYDPGQEALRAKGDAMGAGNVADIRWYEMEEGGPRIEAYRGFASVKWEPEGGKMDDLDAVKVTLGGRGKRNVIAHPDA